MRHNVFTALLEMILAAKTEDEINQVCAAITDTAQHTQQITAKDEDLLYRVINATNDNRR